MEEEINFCGDVMRNMLELRNSGKLCDVNIVKDSSVINAHSCVLAAKSSFFLEFLSNFSGYDWSVKTPLRIYVSDITKCKNDNDNCVTCTSRVIEFLYSGRIDIDSAHIEHLINISQNLELQVLQDLCKKFQWRNETSLNQKKDSHIQSSVFYKEMLPEKNKKNCYPLKTNEPNLSSLSREGTSEFEHLERKYIEKYTEHYCKQCNLKFNSFQMADTHRKVFHSKHFVCLSCDFKTHKLSYIIYHLVNMNHDERYCSVCLFEVPDKNSLKDHLNDHKHDLPFKCYDCNTAFKARKVWLRHVLKHQKELYVCEQCDSSFFSKASFSSHNLSHNDTSANFICEICGYKSLYKSVFTRHCLKHKGVEEKYFACPVIPCSFRSNFRYNLKEHILSHDSKQSFTCDLCALKFTKERNLKRHIETVHSQERTVYNCCRCAYKNNRVDKAKAHCGSAHPNDSEALRFVIEQHYQKKQSFSPIFRKKDKSRLPEDRVKGDSHSRYLPVALTENNCEIEHRGIESCNGMRPKSVKKAYVLSETTGEFHIISENEGEQIPVASVTSTNVLTIGNFRKGTGSVTLNETTGVVTFNNINSDSTGAVFLNESTGELSYINLGNDSFNTDIGNREVQEKSKFHAQLSEFTNEVNDDDSIFDSFDMDIGNEDSCDGFDDLDGILFDPIDVENTDPLDILMANNDSDTRKVIPHLNEATGELSFDYIDSQKNGNEVWQSAHNEYKNGMKAKEEKESSYKVLLNEFTGEFS